MVDRVSLYGAPTTVADAEAIAGWLEGRIDAEVDVRDRFLDVHRSDELPERFAEARVTNPHDPDTGNTMLGIVRYEERALEDPEREGDVLYDGNAVQSALNAAIPVEASGLDHLHVALVDRAIGNWGDHDGRWHKRVAVLGQPAIVSVPGLYEAPAKPETYYKEKQRHALLSGDAPPREVLENQVEGDFLIEDDPRTTEALCGYVLAALNLIETGEAFCETEGCRLFDAHYQEALIDAQLRDPEFCETHDELYGE